MAMSEDRARSDATQRRMETAALPPFGEERAAVWGAAWGAASDAGRLRRVLVRAPGSELERIDAGAYDPAADALVDPEGRWYWLGSEPPDVGRAHAQHAALAAALEAEGVTVDRLAPLGDRFAKAMYVRDPLVVLPEGVLVGRMGVRMRRGEEAAVTAEAAALGAPVLATVTGDGVLEGGTVLRLAPDVWAAGTGVRCNARGFERLREVLGWMGVELAVRAAARAGRSTSTCTWAWSTPVASWPARTSCPTTSSRPCASAGSRCSTRRRRSPRASTCSASRRAACSMAAGNPRTEEVLARAGVEVVTVGYDELWKNGGGIHCSTQELIRDPL